MENSVLLNIDEIEFVVYALGFEELSVTTFFIFRYKNSITVCRFCLSTQNESIN